MKKVFLALFISMFAFVALPAAVAVPNPDSTNVHPGFIKVAADTAKAKPAAKAAKAKKAKAGAKKPAAAAKK